MALKPNRVKMANKGGLKSPVLESDNYPARLVQVIDLGQQQNFFDPEKVNHEVMLTYELTTEFCLDDKDEPVEDKPRWLSENINMIDLPIGMTVNDIYNDQYRGKSKMVLRSRAFDPKGTLEFDFSQMLGKPCAVTVVQKKKKDGDLRNDVGGLTPPMKGLTIDELVNEPKFFSLDEPDLEIFFSLPQWLQDKIKGNLNYGGSVLEEAIGNYEPKEEGKKEAPKPKKSKPAPQEEADEGEDDDTPW